MTLHEQFKKLKRAKVYLENLWVKQYNERQDMTQVNKDLDAIANELALLTKEARARMALGQRDSLTLTLTHVAVTLYDKPTKIYEWNEL